MYISVEVGKPLATCVLVYVELIGILGGMKETTIHTGGEGKRVGIESRGRWGENSSKDSRKGQNHL